MKTVKIYEPIENDFKSYYDDDKINQTRQKWSGNNGYWYWILKFYNGNTIFLLGKTKGWKEITTNILDKTQNDKKDAITKKLNILGISISKEWSKDNSVRKINTTDLKKWYNSIEFCLKSSTLKIDECISSIESDVSKKYTTQR